MDLPQTFHHLNLYENQAPRTAVVPARTVAPSRREAGSRQDREQCGVSTGAGSGKDTVPPNHSAARRVLYGPPNAHDTQLTSVGWDHIYRNDVPGEGNYDTMARHMGALIKLSPCLICIKQHDRAKEDGNPERLKQ